MASFAAIQAWPVPVWAVSAVFTPHKPPPVRAVITPLKVSLGVLQAIVMTKMKTKEVQRIQTQPRTPSSSGAAFSLVSGDSKGMPQNKQRTFSWQPSRIKAHENKDPTELSILDCLFKLECPIKKKESQWILNLSFPLGNLNSNSNLGQKQLRVL